MDLPLLVFAEFLGLGGADSVCAARLVNPSLELTQKRPDHGEHGERGDKLGCKIC